MSQSTVNVPSSTRWHQGFGIIRKDEVQAVPFRQEETARRWATCAFIRTKTSMMVELWDDLWVYRPNVEMEI